MMKKGLILILSLFATSNTLVAQSPNVNRAEDEFPGLQLLPPGSKVKGISIPRYDKHRVCALLLANELEVVSRSEITLSGIMATLYDQKGNTTTVKCAKAGYDFKRKAVISNEKTEVNNPNFSASGSGVTFTLSGRIGLVKGPVRTTIRTGKARQKK